MVSGRRPAHVSLRKTKSSKAANDRAVQELFNFYEVPLPSSTPNSLPREGGAPQPSSVGKVVGANASPIGHSNIGNQMLLKLGWSPGSGLGRNETGITEPLKAVMLPKGRGLGA